VELSLRPKQGHYVTETSNETGDAG